MQLAFNLKVKDSPLRAFSCSLSYTQLNTVQALLPHLNLLKIRVLTVETQLIIYYCFTLGRSHKLLQIRSNNNNMNKD